MMTKFQSYCVAPRVSHPEHGSGVVGRVPSTAPKPTKTPISPRSPLTKNTAVNTRDHQETVCVSTNRTTVT